MAGAEKNADTAVNILMVYRRMLSAPRKALSGLEKPFMKSTTTKLIPKVTVIVTISMKRVHSRNVSDILMRRCDIFFWLALTHSEKFLSVSTR